MNRLLYCGAIALLFFTTACFFDDNSLVGSDVIITEDRPAEAFDRVEVGSALNVTLVSGASPRVTVRGNDNLIDRITTEVSDGTLRIDLRRGSYRQTDFHVEIVLPDLLSLDVRQASRATVTGFSALGTLRLDVSDASNVTIGGSRADRLEAVIKDASNVRAFGMSANVADLTVRDASNAEITVVSELRGRVAGASTLRYRGQPAIEVDVSGASNLRDGN